MPVSLLVYWSASTDPTVTNYKIYHGTSPGSYSDSITVGNVLNMYYPVSGTGIHYFAIASISSVTGESVKGTEFSAVVVEPIGVVRGVIRRQAY